MITAKSNLLSWIGLLAGIWERGYFRNRDDAKVVVSPKAPTQHTTGAEASPLLEVIHGSYWCFLCLCRETLPPCILAGWVSFPSSCLQLLEPWGGTAPGNLVHLSLPRHMTFVYLLGLIPTPGGRECSSSKGIAIQSGAAIWNSTSLPSAPFWGWIEVCSCLAKEKQCDDMGGWLVPQRWQVNLRSRGRCLDCKIA